MSETDQPVILLVGGNPELMSLVRLESFRLKSAMEKAGRNRKKGPSEFNVLNARRMMKLVDKGGKIFPFGQLKHARNWVQAMKYWTLGGAENVKNLLVCFGREYAGLKLPKPAPPQAYPEMGIHDPFSGKYFDRTEDYLEFMGFDPAKPSVGLLFYDGMHFAQSLIPLKALAEHWTRNSSLNYIPVFSGSGKHLEAVRRFLTIDGKPRVKALVYFRWFQMGTFAGGDGLDTIKLLKNINVPIFDGTPMFGREVQKWLECIQGLSPVETLTTVILPEIDGMIEPLPSCGLEETWSETVEGNIKTVVPIPDRIERLAGRIEAWNRLASLKNQDKRVAFIIYSNPPGEGRLGVAAYLDVFESLRKLFLIMKERGYRVENIPQPGEFPELLIAKGIVNGSQWGVEGRTLKEGKNACPDEYLEWLAGLPAGPEVSEDWGQAPGSIMVEDGKFLLPALEFGNILLGLQPSRGAHFEPDKITHDKTLPPHHQYVAYYRWLEQVWQPDAVVHVGTHGTLEFLKGKELGMSQYCWPAALIGNRPHLYFYHVVNASEATIAKRRSLGVLVNYNSPSFTTSDLYEEYTRLDELIDEYIEAVTLDPARSERLTKAILEKAAALNIPLGSVAEIQEELNLMKRSIIPKGLHTLGCEFEEEDVISFATFLARYDRGGVPSLHRLLAKAGGYDYDLLLASDPKACPGLNPGAILGKIEDEAREMIARSYQYGCKDADRNYHASLEYVLKVAGQLDCRLEIENFLNGLDGGYVEPALGGDPLRNNEVLPTGRNSFQFNPLLVPSEEAVKRGMEITENTLAHYFKLHGEYPRSTAVILWGFETTKTRGETVGQILSYLGVRLVPGGNQYFRKIEAIPLVELGRPRIDCLVQICGFFRDMYPNVMDIINRAFALVSELDEDENDNFVRANTLNLERELEGKVPKDKLKTIAAGRIFGPRAGEYGTRTIALIETGAWESEEEIARLFTQNMSHLYAEGIHGERYLDAYHQRIGQVDMVSQVRDTHEYEIMDLDHYYEFFGGLSRTVEMIRGQAPEMLISDTSKELIRTETVKESLDRGLRTRLLNPKWIEAMLVHDFHGAQEVSERVTNLIGFAATTHAVENWVWSAVAARYVFDGEMFEKLSENNRFAAEETIKRLLEAEKRGYWNASPEEIEKLKERYLELESKIEEKIEP